MEYTDFDDSKEKRREYLKLLLPKEYASSIFTINIDRLFKNGIRGIIIDLDDTLLPRGVYKIPFAVYSWIEKVKEYGIKICLVSNGSSSKRIEYVSNSLGIKGFAFSLKPLPFALKKAMAYLKTSPEQTAIIGDQILTDILGGNLVKAHTILVKPVAEEVSLVRMPMRFVENFLINFLKLEIDS